MKFFSITLFTAGLVYSASESKPVAQEQCVPGQPMNVMLGMSNIFYESDIKPTIPREQWPKVCGEETIKCGSNGKYKKCINDTWVAQECPCSGLNCGSGYQSHTCSGVVRN